MFENAHIPSKKVIYSPLRYPGGKSMLSPLLANVIASMPSVNRYVEPYCGGAGAGLALLFTGIVDEIVVNDIDPSVYAFWKACVEFGDDLADMVLSAELSIDEWDRQKQIYKESDPSDPLRLGFSFFYLNRTNRSGALNGGVIGGRAQSGAYLMDARFNRIALSDRVRRIHDYREKILVVNRDGVEVIREYGPLNNTFIYADPPYFEKAGTLYLNAFSDEDHEVLAQTLKEHPDSNWILSYDNVDQVAALYDGMSKRFLSVGYSAHRVTKATEVMVFSESIPSTVIDEHPIIRKPVAVDTQ